MNKCDALLLIADDYEDNVASIRCQLEAGHEGPHLERFQRNGKKVEIVFECDERQSEGETDAQ